MLPACLHFVSFIYCPFLDFRDGVLLFFEKRENSSLYGVSVITSEWVAFQFPFGDGLPRYAERRYLPQLKAQPLAPDS